MEATFVVNPKEVDPQMLERMIGFFADKEESITIRISEAAKPEFDFQQWFQGMEDIRTHIGPITIPADFDVNAIIDEVNDMEL